MAVAPADVDIRAAIVVFNPLGEVPLPEAS
jgi:hypothetical protein